MFANVNAVETKFEDFLFRAQKRKMVRGEFISYRSVGRDADVIRLVSQLTEKTGRDDGMFTIFYAQRRIYTVNLTFDWHPDAPAYFRSLETYWEMTQAGEPEEECYLFFVNNCQNMVSQEWQQALESAQTYWTPPEEGWDDDLEDDEEEPEPEVEYDMAGEVIAVRQPRKEKMSTNGSRPGRKKKAVADPNS